MSIEQGDNKTLTVPESEEYASDARTTPESEEYASDAGTTSKSEEPMPRPLSEAQLKDLEEELSLEMRKSRTLRLIKNIAFTMATVAAMAVLITTLWMPVLRIFGSSMTPTLYEGNVVVTVKSSDMKQGDVIAFYYNNTVLVKRLIGVAGDWIDMDEDGNVYVNGEMLDEPYVDQKAFGECNIELPCQVPENRVFVMGDHRSVSIDSRNTSIGFVPDEQIVGHIALCIWPLNRIKKVE